MPGAVRLVRLLSGRLPPAVGRQLPEGRGRRQPGTGRAARRLPPRGPRRPGPPAPRAASRRVRRGGPALRSPRAPGAGGGGLPHRWGGARPARKVTTAAGSVEAKAPWVNDKRTDLDAGDRERFSSTICREAQRPSKISEVLGSAGRASPLGSDLLPLVLPRRATPTVEDQPGPVVAGSRRRDDGERRGGAHEGGVHACL